MQLGGNANALVAFKNCGNVDDAQLKYKSRAAQLYRDKLHSMAAQAMRLHGTKLFIEAAADKSVEDEDKNNEDEEHDDKAFFDGQTHSEVVVANNGTVKKTQDLSEQGPNVEAALSVSSAPATQQQRKPTIGARKTTAAKKGLGAKKTGLGGQRVKKDFAEIEREAELADQIRSKEAEEAKSKPRADTETEEKAMASMRLAYQDLGVQQKKAEDKMRRVDPKKAEQVERLGMASTRSSAFTHSAITEMSTIEQEEPKAFGGGKSSNFYGSSKFTDDFEEDFEERRSTTSPSSNWEKEFEVIKSTSEKRSEWNNNFESDVGASRSSRSYASSSSSSRNAGASAATSSDDAQKKFGGAKAISSDMYFSGENRESGGPDANLSRFSGQTSISSADYFGRQETLPSK